MTFDLLPTITPWIIGFLVVAAVGAVLALGSVVALVAPHRRVRLARHQSLRTYYGRHLALGH